MWSNFNPLPSCEGRPSPVRNQSSLMYFNPLPSREGRPVPSAVLCGLHRISIHSPHARGDWCRTRTDRRGGNFNPLPSHEGRRNPSPNVPLHRPISIHSPHMRGDDLALYMAYTGEISIHSPHTRGDERGRRAALWHSHFNPLPSHEGRPIN